MSTKHILYIYKDDSETPLSLGGMTVTSDGRICREGQYLVTAKFGGLSADELKPLVEQKKYDEIPEVNFLHIGLTGDKNGAFIEVLTSEQDNERRRQTWEADQPYELVTTHKAITPRGGEMGRDGYYDRTYRDKTTGETIRMITRDVFDFGVYHTPERFGKMTSTKAEWTDGEIALAKYLGKGDTRM